MKIICFKYHSLSNHGKMKNLKNKKHFIPTEIHVEKTYCLNNFYLHCNSPGK